MYSTTVLISLLLLTVEGNVSFGKLLKKYVSDADIFYVKEKNANGQNVVETAYAFVNYPGNESVVVSSGKDEDIQHQNNYQNSLTFVQLSELSDTTAVIKVGRKCMYVNISGNFTDLENIIQTLEGNGVLLSYVMTKISSDDPTALSLQKLSYVRKFCRKSLNWKLELTDKNLEEDFLITALGKRFSISMPRYLTKIRKLTRKNRKLKKSKRMNMLMNGNGKRDKRKQRRRNNRKNRKEAVTNGEKIIVN